MLMGERAKKLLMDIKHDDASDATSVSRCEAEASDGPTLRRASQNNSKLSEASQNNSKLSEAVNHLEEQAAPKVLKKERAVKGSENSSPVNRLAASGQDVGPSRMLPANTPADMDIFTRALRTSMEGKRPKGRDFKDLESLHYSSEDSEATFLGGKRWPRSTCRSVTLKALIGVAVLGLLVAWLIFVVNLMSKGDSQKLQGDEDQLLQARRAANGEISGSLSADEENRAHNPPLSRGEESCCAATSSASCCGTASQGTDSQTGESDCDVCNTNGCHLCARCRRCTKTP
jgi:hypothetical protein